MRPYLKCGAKGQHEMSSILQETQERDEPMISSNFLGSQAWEQLFF